MVASNNADPHLAVQTVGQGPVPLVFLHGLLGRGRNFISIARKLSEQSTSYLVDLPNHGASAWTQEFSYAEMADSVNETLREHGVEQAVVVGHSMGGKVAMMLALRHPEVVMRLMVVDISPVPADYSRGDVPFGHLLDAMLAVDLGQLATRNDAHRAMESEVPDQGVRAFLLQNLLRSGDGWAWQPNVEQLRGWLTKIGDFPLPNQTPAYQGSVAWVGGSDSDYIDEDAVPRMRELFPSVRRITVKGAGHWVHADQPAHFTEILKTFVRREMD